jgi:hypothetical protein
MGHHISARISEHIDFRLENYLSVVAELSTETRHSTDFDKSKIIAYTQTHHMCIIKNAIKITKH